MDESTLLRCAISGSLVGLFALLVIAGFAEVPVVQIHNISSVPLDTDVVVLGVVLGVRDAGKVAFIDIAEPQTVSVMVFKDHNLTVEKGQSVRVKGAVTEYNGKREIISSEISII